MLQANHVHEGEFLGLRLNLFFLQQQELQFNDPLLVKLSAHLAPAVLRIGGTDQNNFGYDMASSKPMDCECHKPCTMTAPYWKTVNDFLNVTGETKKKKRKKKSRVDAHRRHRILKKK